ncbi:hypothetical protein JCM17823_18230 [Halorubrum gandharaense]
MQDESTDAGPVTTRRRLLATSAAAGTVATAGCLGTRDGAVPGPSVVDQRIDDGWRLLEESDGVVFEESFGPVTIRALERTDLYEYVDVAEALADAFGVEGSPVLFFASRIDMRPAIDQLPGGIGRGRLMEEVQPAAEAAFRDQLRESGLESVELEETEEVTVASGHEATAFRFTARFPLDGEMELPVGGTESVEGVIDLEARLAVWHDGTDVLLSGGAYPTEPISDAIDRSLSDALDADDVIEETLDEETADVLATDPETFAEAVDALLVSVE